MVRAVITITPELLVGTILRRLGGKVVSAIASLSIPAGSPTVYLEFTVPSGYVYVPTLYRVTVAPDGSVSLKFVIDNETVHEDGYAMSSTYEDFVPFSAYGYPIEAKRFLRVEITQQENVDVDFAYWGIGALLTNEAYRKIRERFWEEIERWLGL